MGNQSEDTNLLRRNTFKKEERLCSKKVIDKLFSEGNSFLVYPLKIVFMKIPPSQNASIQAAFTVGKRNFKLAVHRNKIKRIIRETYRLNKWSLYNELIEDNLVVFFIFIGKSIPDYKLVETAMKKAILKLGSEISDNK